MNDKQIEQAILSIQNLKCSQINERDKLFWLIQKIKKEAQKETAEKVEKLKYEIYFIRGRERRAEIIDRIFGETKQYNPEYTKSQSKQIKHRKQ